MTAAGLKDITNTVNSRMVSKINMKPCDMTVETAPKSILKKRKRAAPSTWSTARIWCKHLARSIPEGFSCARRQIPSIRFCDSVDVTSFARAVGTDAVPIDGGKLAVGLGAPVGQGTQRLAPGKRHGEGVKDLSELPPAKRYNILKESLGHSFERAAYRHCDENTRVLKHRKDSQNDEKDPPELMPSSYQEALERAKRVAEEVAQAEAEDDMRYSSPVSRRVPVHASPPRRASVSGLTERIQTAPSPSSPRSKKHHKAEKSSCSSLVEVLKGMETGTDTKTTKKASLRFKVCQLKWRKFKSRQEMVSRVSTSS